MDWQLFPKNARANCLHLSGKDTDHGIMGTRACRGGGVTAKAFFEGLLTASAASKRKQDNVVQKDCHIEWERSFCKPP